MPEGPYFYWVRARNAGGVKGLAGLVQGVRRQPVPGDVMVERAVDGIVHASPALAPDGTLYVGVQNRTDTVSPCALYALNPDGTKWSYMGTTSTFGSPAIGPDGTIYYGAYHQNLIALNPDGSREWEFNPKYAVVGTPAIGHDGTVYFGALGAGFYAFDPDGSKRVVVSQSTLRALRPTNGSQYWKVTPYAWTSGVLVDADGTVLATTTDHVVELHLLVSHDRLGGGVADGDLEVGFPLEAYQRDMSSGRTLIAAFCTSAAAALVAASEEALVFGREVGHVLGHEQDR